MVNEAIATNERILEEPLIDASNQEFWKASSQSVFLIKQCLSCGKSHWYPRALCPYCMGDTAWVKASGRGTIYSVSVTRRAGPVTYALAYVELDEGVTLLTNIVNCDLDALRIGDRVKVIYKATPGGAAVPMFTPE